MCHTNNVFSDILEFYFTFHAFFHFHFHVSCFMSAAVDKVATMKIFPNALLIKCADGEEYFFGSFTNRNGCYSFLKLKIGEANRWKSDDASKLPWMSRNLVFGWQVDSMNLSGKSGQHIGTGDDITEIDDPDEDEDVATVIPTTKADIPDEPNDNVDMDTLFLKSTIAPLLSERVPTPGEHVFGTMWKSSSNFKYVICGIITVHLCTANSQ